jgi:rhamnogalacturonan endolyase
VGAGGAVIDREAGVAGGDDSSVAADGSLGGNAGGTDGTGTTTPRDAAEDIAPSPDGVIEAGGAPDPGGLCPNPSGPAVTMTTTGTTRTITNGLVSLTIAGSGQLTQLASAAKNLMGAGDSLYVSESGGANYHALGASASTVVQQSSDLVEVAYTDTSGAPLDMDWELHYVVRRGVSGFYYFLVAKVGTTTHPNPATLSELRTVHRLDASILSNGYNGERHGALPTQAQNATFSTATQIQDTTWPLTVAPLRLAGAPSQAGLTGQFFDEGPVYSKYDWATYRTEDRLHGLYGHGYGVFLISPSWEFYTGGPLKQELMVHQSNLILNMYHGGHFGSAVGTASPANWSKMYGPNLVYVNTGSDDQVIADAVAKAESERAQWPYCWMKSALYPLSKARAKVTGTLVEARGRSVAGAVVTLASAGPLLDQGYDYMFWAQADKDGHFTISEVRLGTYAVHVYATQGTIIADTDSGEIVKNVTIAAGDNDLGTLTWKPDGRAKLLWSIGTSDRRAGEFRFSPTLPASSENIAARTGRMYGLDDKNGVWTVPPADLTYTVGASNPQSDWYFAQSATGTWTVAFDLAEVPAQGALLTIGVAGAARAPKLAVAVNGQAVLGHTFGNDSSLYRSALQGGRFERLSALVPAASLKAGANKVTFSLTATGGAGIFYDAITMESD